MRLAIRFLLFLVALPLAVATAYAAGGGGGGGNSGGSAGGGSNNQTITKCKRGLAWDMRRKRCVAQQRGMLDDESIYEAGRQLAAARRYGEAIALLSLAADKTDPRILNYLGFSHRMQGRVLVGLGYYQEALIQDPGYVPAREYMGEAYLQLGDIGAAREQLGEIGLRCGTTCSEYSRLSTQIGLFLEGGGWSPPEAADAERVSPANAL
jgi:hypothetical protein